MFARFVCALLGFCLRDFPVISGPPPWTFIVGRRYYVKVMGALDTDTLTPEQKRKDLRATNTIKNNNYGNIKGINCAYGVPHIKYIMKEGVMSPNNSQEALMVSLVQYDHNGRKTIIFDIPGAYLNA